MKDGGRREGGAPEEPADRVSFDEIDSIIEGLSAGDLASFVNNEKLNAALEKDAYIISSVSTRGGITRSCEHGLRISSIIKHKALKLNETTALELLDSVLKIYLEKFAQKPGESAPSAAAEDATHSSATTQASLDFTRLSQHFPSGVLAYSSLSWDSLPLSGLTASEGASQQRQRRPPASSASPAPPKELDVLLVLEQQLETKERVERIRELLRERSGRGPLDFWEFVLDPDPAEGFNNTCFNLYSLTFLATRGEIELFSSDSQVLIKARDSAAGNSVNFQSIVTGWSHRKWTELVRASLDHKAVNNKLVANKAASGKGANSKLVNSRENSTKSAKNKIAKVKKKGTGSPRR